MEAFRALIVAPAWIGDTVMAQPLFMRLHRRIPGLQLDALAPPWVAPVLRRMPEIAGIIDNPEAGLNSFRNIADALQQGA